MTENPYASPSRSMSQDQAEFDPRYTDPGRTSKLAVIAFIAAVPCCLTGPLGALLGVVSAFRVQMSGGRLRGLGWAIAATVLGLIGGAAQLAIGYGASTLSQQVTALASVVEDVQAGDFAAARASSFPLDTTITDEQLADFGQRVSAVYGQYQGNPTEGITGFFGEFGFFAESLEALGQDAPTAFQGGGAAFPVAADFANGRATMWYLGINNPQGLPIITNILVGAPGMEIVWLDQPAFATPPATPATPGADPTDPAEGAIADPAEAP